MADRREWVRVPQSKTIGRPARLSLFSLIGADGGPITSEFLLVRAANTARNHRYGRGKGASVVCATESPGSLSNFLNRPHPAVNCYTPRHV